MLAFSIYFILRSVTDVIFLPGVVLGVGLAGSIGSMIGVFLTPPERTVQKHIFWLVRAFFSRLRMDTELPAGF
jgi:hypothetical protein